MVSTFFTMLTACGGGGGGGYGNIPNTTLPDIAASNAKITSMSNKSFSNSSAAKSKVDKANKAILGGFSRRFRAMPIQEVSEAEAFTYFNEMYDYFCEKSIFDENGKIDDTKLAEIGIAKLKVLLLLAGFNVEELPDAEDDFKNWVEINILEIDRKSQKEYEMYGSEKLVGLENAKLNVVNIDSKQDSYVSFTLDENDEIVALHFDVDQDSADGRYMKLDRQKDNKFTRTGKMLIYGVKLETGIPNSSKDIRLELFDEPKDIDTLRKMLVAALHEEKEQGSLNDVGDIDQFMTDAVAKINSLTLESFSKTEDTALAGEAFREGSEVVTTVTYVSYAKKIGENGLQHSDFGTVHIDSMEGDEKVNETFVFAGGLDAKKVQDKTLLQGTMNFKGDAVATVIYQDDRGDDRIEQTKSYAGKANLDFEDGKETLTTTFNDWYNVTVTSSTDTLNNYNIAFTDGGNISAADAQYYKFQDVEKIVDPVTGDDVLDANGNPTFNISQKDALSENNFVGGRVDDSSYGAVDIGYYGENGSPEEATGFVAYGEDYVNNTGVHAQIGFGTQIVK